MDSPHKESVTRKFFPFDDVGKWYATNVLAAESVMSDYRRNNANHIIYIDIPKIFGAKRQSLNPALNNQHFFFIYIASQPVVFNSLLSGDAYMRQRVIISGNVLVPNNEPLTNDKFCQLDPWGQNSVKFNQNSDISWQKNALENIVCKTTAILFWCQCVRCLRAWPAVGQITTDSQHHHLDHPSRGFQVGVSTSAGYVEVRS